MPQFVASLSVSDSQRFEPSLSQSLSPEGVATTVMHESGQWLAFPPFAAAGNPSDPQKHGSQISYSRRYSFLSVMGLATEDDDGHLAGRPTVTTPTAPAKPDPKQERIAILMADMKRLDSDGKESVKALAATEDRSLSAKALAEDDEWLDNVAALVEALLDS